MRDGSKAHRLIRSQRAISVAAKYGSGCQRSGSMYQGKPVEFPVNWL
jgi:hypothetical protein